MIYFDCWPLLLVSIIDIIDSRWCTPFTLEVNHRVTNTNGDESNYSTLEFGVVFLRYLGPNIFFIERTSMFWMKFCYRKTGCNSRVPSFKIHFFLDPWFPGTKTQIWMKRGCEHVVISSSMRQAMRSYGDNHSWFLPSFCFQNQREL